MEKSENYNHFILNTPKNKDEAYEKWQACARTIQLLQVAYNIPEARINQAISLAINSK